MNEADVSQILIDLDNTDRSLSWRQSRSIVRKLVAGFRAAGLQPGDCVSIASFNDIMYPMLFLGLVGAGGIFSGSNPACAYINGQQGDSSHVRGVFLAASSS